MLIKMAAVKLAKAAFTGGVGLFFSKGGVVPDYMSNGGKVVYAAEGMNMQPKGTDTVPAMLTPGERVLSVADNKAFETLMSSLQLPSDEKATNSSNTTNNNQQDNRSFSFNNEQMGETSFNEFLDEMERLDVNPTRR